MNKKRILIFTIINSILINIYAQDIPKPALDTIPEKVYEFVEIPPEFPGGTSALLKYLSANITYPVDAGMGAIEGKVYVKIIVNHNGNVVNPTIIRGLYPSIDSAVLITLQNMPKWKPGMQNGKAVDVYYTIPVYFQLAADSEITSDEKIYSFTEQIPEFIGGEKAMKNYFKENMQYPDLAKQEKIHGKVYIKFVVNEDGSLTNVLVTRGIGGGCDEEALRLVKAMPLWAPAKQNGKVVKCYFTVPVEF
jgi:TonB family protein